MRLVMTGTLSRFFEIIQSATDNLVPFVENVLDFITEPINEAIVNAVGDVPILSFVLELVGNLLGNIFGEEASILTICLSSAVVVFLIMHIIAFLNKVVGSE